LFGLGLAVWDNYRESAEVGKGMQPGSRESRFESQRHKIIRSVTSPLGFFVLALLSLEAFIGSVVIFGNLPTVERTVFIGVGILSLLLIVGAVVYLVVNHPRNLVFTDSSHLRIAELTVFGTEAHPLDPHEVEMKTSIPGPPVPPQPANLMLLGQGSQGAIGCNDTGTDQ
jgi:hypothetical protein